MLAPRQGNKSSFPQGDFHNCPPCRRQHRFYWHGCISGERFSLGLVNLTQWLTRFWRITPTLLALNKFNQLRKHCLGKQRYNNNLSVIHRILAKSRIAQYNQLSMGCYEVYYEYKKDVRLLSSEGGFICKLILLGACEALSAIISMHSLVCICRSGFSLKVWFNTVTFIQGSNYTLNWVGKQRH